MRTACLFLVAAFCLASASHAQDAAAGDMKRMTGEFEIIEFIAFGQRKTEPKTLTIADGKLNTEDGLLKIELNPEASPRQIDLKIEGRTQYLRGIYEFGDDGILKISWGALDVGLDNPAGRPSTFNTDNDQYVHLKLRKKQ